MPQQQNRDSQTGPASPDDALRLAADDIAFIQSSVSVLAAAEGPGRRPVIARAIAARVEPASGRVRICLRSLDAAALVAGAAANDRVAAMFSRPQTNETIQVKGDRVTIEPPDEADNAARRRYLPAMIAELMPLGFDPALIGCVLSDYGSPLTVLTFRPTVMFDQTPGPGAGGQRACRHRGS